MSVGRPAAETTPDWNTIDRPQLETIIPRRPRRGARRRPGSPRRGVRVGDDGGRGRPATTRGTATGPMTAGRTSTRAVDARAVEREQAIGGGVGAVSGTGGPRSRARLEAATRAVSGRVATM